MLGEMGGDAGKVGRQVQEVGVIVCVPTYIHTPTPTHPHPHTYTHTPTHTHTRTSLSFSISLTCASHLTPRLSAEFFMACGYRVIVLCVCVCVCVCGCMCACL